ncbi:hypothetical protein IHE51_00425 [Candidatus Parvarchaeota archaeon]|uniref:Uncharacterized protein n=1 Tax=Candidatus Acidifodinimicrobium mancum TaxID=2898728 RepID=A0A8T3UQY1_9ARCH|nr:hypothetical protein [Candidatus Acidifodinimicrobium mancum]MBE5728919.1 hypothetical protein [Candidatus Acidifodinimicrobium mancum]MBE5729888.1 hypothetical protein [Candidatus Acidifodinimicrobium mancum]
MAVMELFAFLNAGILIIAFALLLVVLSFSVSQVNSVMTFATAKAFAEAVGTRLITSPNCFAYKQTLTTYNSNRYTDMQANTVSTEYATYPDTVSYSKVSNSLFLSCIQYAYYGGATNVPFSNTLIPAFAGVEATLTDTQDPTGLGGLSSMSVSNNAQFNYGSILNKVKSQLATFGTDAEYTLLAVSIAANIALTVATGGTININIIGAVGSNAVTSIAPQYAVAYLLSSENTYTESFPVQIMFTNSQNQPLYTQEGLLTVTITYGSPYV